MFSVRLTEIALPTSEREIDNLVGWFIDTLCLVRKRGEATADQGRAGPVHRLLRDYLFAQPEVSWDAQMLADELALTPASLNHHLTRLVEAGIIGFSNEGKGWRRYFLRGGSLTNAIEFFGLQCETIVKQRMALLDSKWNRSNPNHGSEPVPTETPPLLIGIVDHRPLLSDSEESLLSQWMGDFGLLGERPGKEAHAESISVQLFELLLSRDLPLSLDEASEILDEQKPRIGRILERFRSTGMVQRVPRIDRLNIALWSAMTAQHQRRGEDWMLKKGGFQRLLNSKQQSSILSSLKKGKLKVEEVEKGVKDISSDNQMLLLNLLGGRLPLGHRMAGYTTDEVHREISSRIDRTLRRMRRVAQLLEQSMAS
jgi:predicted transcriptional regulator